jgi:hypothetical protein
MKDIEVKNGIRLYLLISLAGGITLFLQLIEQARSLDILWISRRWTGAILLLGLFCLVLSGLLIFSWSDRGRSLVNRWQDLRAGSTKTHKFFWILSGGYFLAAATGLAWLILGPYGKYFPDLIHRLPVLALLVTLASFILQLVRPHTGIFQAWGFSAVLLMVGYRIAIFAPDISLYPFSMGWSETSRYYYASLFFSERLYGLSVPLPVLHPSRYLLQAIPFLLGETPLWFHRFWQVLLWICLPLLAVILLARRLHISSRWIYWFYILWAFLFIYQGPIYYHLAVCLIIVLLGYDADNPGRTLLAVLLASLWAGISRVNWIPVPGLVAATLYLLENRVKGQKWWRYLALPALWTFAGVLAGLGSQLLYAFSSGNEPEHFSTSFTSDLLWYRLFPNPTYREGILPSILIVSLPLLFLIFERLSRLRWRLHPLRLLGLLGVLGVFLAGGLLVSVKIGGGNNLHNLDAYLFFLLLIASAFYFNRVEAEQEIGVSFVPPVSALVALAVLVPALFILQSGRPVDIVDQRQIENGLEEITRMVESTRGQPGEVLLMSERQLLIFGFLQDVRLVPEYERTYLMEMAMARSLPYLERFHHDLANQRFKFIISQPLNLALKGAKEAFGEENDAWVKYVSSAVLCYYRPSETMRAVDLQILIPAEPGAGDPDACELLRQPVDLDS